MTERELIAEARRVSGGNPNGALRLVVLRLARQRAEDAPLRAAFARTVAASEQEAFEPEGRARPWERRLLAAGYAPLPDRPHVWRGRHGSRATAAQGGPGA